MLHTSPPLSSAPSVTPTLPYLRPYPALPSLFKALLNATRCTLLMVLYLDSMCQCGLHAVLWSLIGTLMHLLAAEPCSTTGLLFSSRCLSGTILLTPFSMVWDWRVSRAEPMLLYWPKLLYLYYSLLLFFPFSSFCL